MSLALELTIFYKLSAAVAEEMGIVLRNSALSANLGFGGIHLDTGRGDMRGGTG
jgi:hypothetical protein